MVYEPLKIWNKFEIISGDSIPLKAYDRFVKNLPNYTIPEELNKPWGIDEKIKIVSSEEEFYGTFGIMFENMKKKRRGGLEVKMFLPLLIMDRPENIFWIEKRSVQKFSGFNDSFLN